MTDTHTVLVELLIAAPIDEVWRALREPAEIARWFGWKYPGLKEEIDLIFAADATADDSAHRILFQETGDVFSLESRGDYTIVRLTRAAPVDGTWDDIYDDTVEGWTTFLQQLRFTLERHPRDERRTVYISGRSRASGDPDPLVALGLEALATAQVGGRYTIRVATGDTLHGSIWFRSKHQIGLTADECGDGLLVVARRPATAGSPHGGGMAVLTFYGSGDRDFEAWRERWHAWWIDAFELIESHPAAPAA
jgi:hypothetical protein